MYPSSMIKNYDDIIWHFRSDVILISTECDLIENFKFIFLNHWPTTSVSVLTRSIT